ncbi:1-acyl-sn-glycerol-3-phosphate acyltransferase [Gordonia sp. X0973]|uniref:lysophospholipid acyltransferase family protein n=1 Tax=Gordonia sp. X0973 TaxID=2742602 RepID=UPI000F536D85|nr:lysophospholipid acyltransferase family protein [Gordonia sp. X0973]QKT05855.1 1-acyl-sn-glycerol-3-phosphate acyltransferase [Gordonia sp. X0973]
MEPVYDSVIAAARTLWAVQGIKFKISGVENVPATGPGVVAINHTGYLDFTLAGIPAFLQGKRKVRFMAKKEVFDNKISGPIMRGCKHIPVDRTAGADSYRAAVDYLNAGELVGVYPEATISRSFEIKGFKSGAARMALESGAPIVPTVIWGAQRIWTKGHPKHLGRTNTPVVIGVAEPLEATGSPDALTAKLHDVMVAKLDELQQQYVELFGPYPEGAYWVPARLGGGAPTLEEANALDDAEQAERQARKEAQRAEGDANPGA